MLQLPDECYRLCLLAAPGDPFSIFFRLGRFSFCDQTLLANMFATIVSLMFRKKDTLPTYLLSSTIFYLCYPPAPGWPPIPPNRPTLTGRGARGTSLPHVPET